MKKFIWIILILAIVGLLFYLNGSSLTSNVVSEGVSEQPSLAGGFVEAGKGNYFAEEYDVLIGGHSKGHFYSALEACHNLYPGSVKAVQTRNSRGEFMFNSRNGESIKKEGYEVLCYR
jgi:predicted phosphodiesterase